ncbi:LOW QUALITY PROTEIN: hypothetical protein U0070_014591 [Myodes glareolus]|uniref:Uncharacterized protein n=1 Tax=Myodes glareolus TaxID=447135 RepID=A0AAW0HBJ0_MYOGA
MESGGSGGRVVVGEARENQSGKNVMVEPQGHEGECVCGGGGRGQLKLEEDRPRLHSEASAPLCSPHQESLSLTERRRPCYKAGPWRICGEKRVSSSEGDEKPSTEPGTPSTSSWQQQSSAVDYNHIKLGAKLSSPTVLAVTSSTWPRGPTLFLIVDVIFADMAQPDQTQNVARNAYTLLQNGGHFVIVIKAN